MASYIVLSQFTEQGIRTVHDTTKRAAAAKDMAAKAGVKLIDIYWTIGPTMSSSSPKRLMAKRWRRSS